MTLKKLLNNPIVIIIVQGVWFLVVEFFGGV